MSNIFALDDAGNAEQAQRMRENGVLATDPVTPGLFDNTFGSVGEGFMRGGIRTLQALDLTAAAPMVLYEKATGQEGKYTDSYFKNLDETIQPALDYWTPSAASTGTAAKVLGQLAETASPLMLAGFNPELMIANAGLDEPADLVKQGVDSGRAVAVGEVSALANAAGFKIPFLGKTLVSRLASGAVGNVAINTGARAAQQAVLTGTPAAQDYAPLNPSALAVDALMGLAFGGLHHLGSPKREPLPSEKDAVATLNNAKHFQDSAPGAPADIGASIAHQDVLGRTITDLARGDEPSAGDELIGQEFHAEPAQVQQRVSTADAIRSAVDETKAESPDSFIAGEDQSSIGESRVRELAGIEMPDATRSVLADRFREAAAVKPEFDAKVKGIADAVGGIADLKGASRAAAKATVDYGGDASKVKDLVRATVVVPDIGHVDAAIAHAVEQLNGKVARNALIPESEPVDKTGYRDAMVRGKINGHPVELQISTPDMLAAKKQAHPLYVEREEMRRKVETEGRGPSPDEQARQAALVAGERSLFDEAWEATKRRNADSDTSVPLRMTEVPGNGLPPGTSQAVARQLESDTGTSSTSKNSVPAGNEAGSATGLDISKTSEPSLPEMSARRQPSAKTAADKESPSQVSVSSPVPQELGELRRLSPTASFAAGFDDEGNPQYRTAADAASEIEAEHAQAVKDAEAFDAAVNCYLRNGS